MSNPPTDLDIRLDSASLNVTTISPALEGSDRDVQLTLTANATSREDSDQANDAADIGELNSSQNAATNGEDIMSNSAGMEQSETNGRNLKELLNLVESWREEVNMMSVKNAILLDDLVKAGADV